MKPNATNGFDADAGTMLDHVLEDIAMFISTYVVMTDAQVHVIALWILHTHLFEASGFTPYLNISSATKRAAKTLLLDIIALLVPNPVKTANMSLAALIRLAQDRTPTLLYDDSDAALYAREDRDAVRGILNSGFKKGGSAWRCVPPAWAVQEFPTFYPKALAGIGDPWDTIRDRSIPIRLQRKLKEEWCERFRELRAKTEADDLKKRIVDLAQLVLEEVENAEPDLPDDLHDRQQDICEPLLAIADTAGGRWPQVARSALIELCTSGEADSETVAERLLAAIFRAFEKLGNEQIFTRELIRVLTEDADAEWREFGKDKSQITPTEVARILRDFRITSRTVRSGKQTAKGYNRSDFEDAWRRHCSSLMDERVTAEEPGKTNVPDGGDAVTPTPTKGGLFGMYPG